MLVVARTDNNQARIAFENRIVEELAKNGIEAKSSFSVFPTNIKMQKELTAENKLALEEFLKNELGSDWEGDKLGYPSHPDLEIWDI